MTSPRNIGGSVKKDSVANIRKGYRQGSTGAHCDGGMEGSHGRSERAYGSNGTQLGKSPRARQDGGMEHTHGKMNERSTMGHSRGYDPTARRHGDHPQSRGMEHSRGVSKRNHATTKDY